MLTRTSAHWVVMGVAGSGKSRLAAAWAEASGRLLLEGDDFHSEAARQRMQAGEPLDDTHRGPWLARMVEALRNADAPAVLAASLLRRAHRQRLREAVPGLRFAHLQLPLAVAQARCAARSGHFFPASLVASQFEALEDPSAEPGVLSLDAQATLPVLLAALHRADGGSAP